SGHDRVADRRVAARGRLDAAADARDIHMIRRYRDASDGCRGPYADAAQIIDPGVLDRHRSAGGAQSDIDAMRGEAVDLAIVDNQSLAGKKADAAGPRAEAIDVEAAKRDLVRRSGAHGDSGRAGNKHTREYTFTGDRDRLRDRHGAK